LHSLTGKVSWGRLTAGMSGWWAGGRALALELDLEIASQVGWKAPPQHYDLRFTIA
jgi:hypothetical protein